MPTISAIYFSSMKRQRFQLMSLTQISGDSSVESVTFQDGVAEVMLRDGEFGDRVCLRIATKQFYSEATNEKGSVSVRVIRLADELPIRQSSGRYMAPETFERQMRVTKKALHLAVGLRASEYPLFLSLQGYRIAFASPIPSEEHVTTVTYDPS